MLLALFALGVLVHALWAITIPVPMDWDPAYYRSIARHIAAGDGAVSEALWSLAWRPPELPMPADLYWMPVPSRVLVPFVLLWRSHGDQLATVLLAATWGPIAYLAARRHGATVALFAGILAASGGTFARFLSTPDSVAVYGAVAGTAWLAAEGGRSILAIGAVMVAALTRNDGFLLAPFVAFLLPDRRAGLAALVAGLGTTAAWHARNASIIGPSYASMRAAAATSLDVEHLSGLTTGVMAAPSLGERLDFVVQQALPAVLIVWILVLPAMWFLARDQLSRTAAAFAVVHPLLALVLAPGVAASGSLFRSAAAVFPVLCATSAAALVSVGRWTAERRGYPPWMAPSVIVMLQGIFWLGLPALAATGMKPALPPRSCDVLDIPASEPVFSPHPLLVEAWCGRPSVLLLDGMDPAQVASDAEAYRVRYALVYPAAKDPAFPTAAPAGWTRVSPAGDIELWAKP